MARRWVCPQCESGVHGPDRPRRDDVRRYCLKCSERTGRLVERTCPALERAREIGRAKSTAKSTAKRARARDAKTASESYRGVNMIAEARRMWALPAMRDAHRGRRLPEIELRRRRNGGHYSTGIAYRSRIVVTMGGDAAAALATLLHELCHAAAPSGEWHGDVWGALFIQAARQRWGAEHFAFGVPSTGARYLSYKIAPGIRAARAIEKGGD